MTKETCFVVMPIGDQEYPGGNVEAKDLKARYDDLIKEALLRAHPALDVVRADEVSAPGAITTDIITRIMHSDYVLGDITYPNPNVYYELGLRHACRLGTIIVRDRSGPNPSFDLAQLRHYDYENTPSGLKALAARLAEYFDHRRRQPSHPDNHFQELAKLTHYEFPDYGKTATAEELQVDAMLAMMQKPELLELMMRAGSGEVSPTEAFRSLAQHPDIAKHVLQAIGQSGRLSPQQKSRPKKKSNR
jgi:hypothetical protein